MKKWIKTLDRILLSGFLKKRYRNIVRKRVLDSYKTTDSYSIESFFRKNENDLLAQLCDKYGSDKGEIEKNNHPYSWTAHNYTDYYSRLFSHCRHHIQKVFECGLGTQNPAIPANMGLSGKPGASLRVWRDYFPQARIFGADIDKNILFTEERIRTFYLDQTVSNEIAGMWLTIGENNFDFILDDGLHTYEAAICLFENSISQLSNDGIYVIEDVRTKEMKRFIDYFRLKPYQADFVALSRPNEFLGDNNLIVIRKQNPV